MCTCACTCTCACACVLRSCACTCARAFARAYLCVCVCVCACVCMCARLYLCVFDTRSPPSIYKHCPQEFMAKHLTIRGSLPGERDKEGGGRGGGGGTGRGGGGGGGMFANREDFVEITDASAIRSVSPFFVGVGMSVGVDVGLIRIYGCEGVLRRGGFLLLYVCGYILRRRRELQRYA